VEESLKEARRVSYSGMMCSVAWHSDVKWGNELHVTIKPKEWWMDLFNKHGRAVCVQEKEFGMFVTIWWDKTGGR